MSNEAEYAGGVLSADVRDTTVSGNVAEEGWGGLGLCTATRCTIEGNSADWAGGTGNGLNRSCLIIDNTASQAGGGTYSGTNNNCTITENSAPIGAGTYDNTTENSIIYFNSPTNWYAGSFSHSCTIPTAGGTGNITNNPEFMDHQMFPYYYFLDEGSPCIHAGTNRTWMIGETDLYGGSRIQGSSVDMGTFER